MVTLYVTETGLILGKFDNLVEANFHHDQLLELFQNYEFPDCTFFQHD